MAPRDPSAWERASSSSSSYFNPSGPFSDFKAPNYPDYTSSFKPSSDESFSRAWKMGFNAAGSDNKKWYENEDTWNTVKEGLFNIAKSKRDGGFDGYTGPLGYPIPGTGGNLLENLSVYESPKTAPFEIAGTPGKKGLGGTIGSIAGTVGGALIGGPVGAAVGALGGPIGSLFG